MTPMAVTRVDNKKFALEKNIIYPYNPEQLHGLANHLPVLATGRNYFYHTFPKKNGCDGGLFLAKITGPGLVYLQSLPFSRMADRIVAASRGHREEGGSKTISTDQGEVKVNEKENKVEVKTNDGNSSETSISKDGESVALPEGYPQDLVPIMDGAKITAANRNEDADKKLSFWITYTVEKEPKEVNGFYQDALKDLTEMQKMEINGVYTNGGNKGDNSVGITINADESEGKKQTIVIIAITPL